MADTDIKSKPEDQIPSELEAWAETEGADLSDDMAGEATLFDANLAMFKEHYSDVYRKLVDYKPVSVLEELEDGDYQVSFQDDAMFHGGAKAQADAQLANIAKYSSRLQIGVSPDGLDNQASPAFEKVLTRFEESGIRTGAAITREDAYFLIVFGIGLGFHLERLVERTNCRTLTLVEPNIDFLYHSLSVFDWCALVEKMQARGRIDFFLTTDPERASRMLQSVFRRDNPIGFDGTMIFRHYKTSLTQGIERRSGENLRTAVMGLGFFQDEINMMAQTYKNLETGKARIMKKIHNSAGYPVMIIGNGPSLEGLLPFIRKNMESAVVISCGSSLEILLEAGITPDFWVMMERGDHIKRLAYETAENFDLSKIRFVGSSTVFPGLQDPFREPLLFFRPGLSPKPLFCLDEEQTPLLCDPMAANAGLSVAMHLGFREAYLLGVDVGSRVQDSGHTKGGWYNRVNDKIKKLSIPLRGNFGGEIWTIPTLQWSKDNLEKLISASRGRRFYNLSDGALIEGAIPLHQKAAKLKKQARNKESVIEEIVAHCPYYDQATFEQQWEKHAIVDSLVDFRNKIIATTEDMDGFEFEHAVAKVFDPNHSTDPLAMIVRGTMFAFCIAYFNHSNRLIDEADREVMHTIMREEFIAMAERLTDRAAEIFMGLEQGEPWEKTFVA